MSIQDWGAIGEIVGAIAVIGTLLYLSVQIRMSAKSQRAQTHQLLAEGRAQSLRLMMEFPSLASGAIKAMRGEELTADEQTHLYWFTLIVLRGFENELYQHTLGMVDDAELEVQRKILLLPHFQMDLLENAFDTFTPQMQVELKKLIEKRRKRSGT